MRTLLRLALLTMVFSKIHFGSFVPPEIKLQAPGFDLAKDGAGAPMPRWFTHPAHLDPAWMHSRQQANAEKPGWLTHPAQLNPPWLEARRSLSR